MNRREIQRPAPGGVVFVGTRSLHNEGVYRLTAEYADRRGLPLLHAEEGGVPAGPTYHHALMVCCPPCGSGFPEWLAFLLGASRLRAERVMVYLDGRYPHHERTARRLFPCPSCAVCDRDLPETVRQLLCSPLSAIGTASSSRRLNIKELAVLGGYLRGMPAHVQARTCGLSVKSIYRLRQSALSRLGLQSLAGLVEEQPVNHTP